MFRKSDKFFPYIENATSRLIELSGLFTLFACLALSALPTYAKDSDIEILPQYVFTANSDPLMQAQNAIEQASAENKYALIVLGAQWCHDSRGLAATFSQEKMQNILNERYVTQFIDVAFLEDRREVTQALGYPTYFATPTVLIVDPATSKLVNIESLPIWQNAASVEHDVYLKEFGKWSKQNEKTNTPKKPNAVYESQSTTVDEFELKHSKRLQAGYDLLGPLLERSANKAAEAEAEQARFFALWDEVKAFRVALQKDIHQYRQKDSDTSKAIASAAVSKKQSWE